MLSLKRQIRILLAINFVLIGLFIVFILSSFKDDDKKKFTEIDAERINIIGTNGKPVMVLSNKRLIPGPGMNGKTYPREFSDGREFFSGMIFFNEFGDEVGGLVYAGINKDSGYYAMEHLSFDQWKQNQVVALQYIDNGKSRRSGLRVWDRPTNVSMDEIFDRFKARNQFPKNSKGYDSITNEIRASAARGDNGVERMFIGSQDEVAQIQIRDKKGVVKAKLYVDANGDPKLEFYNNKVEYRQERV